MTIIESYVNTFRSVLVSELQKKEDEILKQAQEKIKKEVKKIAAGIAVNMSHRQVMDSDEHEIMIAIRFRSEDLKKGSFRVGFKEEIK